MHDDWTHPNKLLGLQVDLHRLRQVASVRGLADNTVSTEQCDDCQL